MEDQERSELHVVLTIILCGTNFFLVGYEAEIHKLSLTSFSEPVYLISKPWLELANLVNVSFNSSAQRLMVKTIVLPC